MRGTIPGLISPDPYLTRLPGVFQDDLALAQMLSAFDELISPVIATIDGLAGYLDPRLAPDDFVDMMADWLGLDLDDHWPLAARREAVVLAVDVHRRRGTSSGIASAVRLLAGPDVEVSIADSGGVSSSPRSGSKLPGSTDASVTVTLTGAVDPSLVRRVEQLVRVLTPAHLVPTVIGPPAATPPSTAATAG